MTKTKSLASLALIALISLISLGFSLPAQATGTNKNKTTASSVVQSSSTNITQAVTQSYNADSSVDLGMLVELKPGVTDTVEPLTQADVKDMLGIAVEPNQAAITLTPADVSHQQVFVASSGRYNVLVSNQNGPIESGDLITASSLDGIGMKADPTESVVLGKAGSAFDGSGSSVVGLAKITNTLGKSVTIQIGIIPVNLDISHNPLQSQVVDFIPSFLSKAATAVSNKPVSAARIYLSLALIIMSCFVTGNMLYSGVRSGMIAVGRNPLSKKSILRSLIQTVMGALIVFVVGIFGVYLLLKL